MLIFKIVMILCVARYIYKAVSAKKIDKSFDYLFSSFAFAILSMIEKVI